METMYKFRHTGGIFMKEKKIMMYKKGKKNNKKKYEPIIFLNSPISSEEKDAIGVMSIVDEIEAAIDENASMIGVIAEYGSGKTSLTELLSKTKKYKRNIPINMWDIINAKDDNDNVGNLTKSFIYQLASGCSNYAASYVNRILNNNYGIVSFCFGYKKVWIFLIIAVISYAFYLLGYNIDYNNFVTLFGDESIKVAMIIKWLAPLLKVVAIFFAALTIYLSTIVFSSWKTESNRKTGLNEVFFAYTYVFNYLKNRKKDRIVIIEDLDRVENKELIINFLKEIYRFNTLCGRKHGKGPVFLISISPEVLLDSNNKTLNESNKPCIKEASQETNEEWLYPKIFDFMVSLKPIHCDDYRNVIYQIITSEPEKQKKLNELLPFNEKVDDNYLPEAFSKLYRGENLSIRELKERLNQTIALFIELRNKDYYGNPSISLEVCACITYLQRTYPKDFHIILKSEKKFSEIIQTTYILRNQPNTTVDVIKKQIDQKLGKIISGEMVVDLATFIFEGLIDLDYRMYLYSFPKGSYIKNIDEKDVCNCLEFPNDYSYDEDDLNDKIRRIELFDKMDSIYEVVDRIANINEIKIFPKCVFENEKLYTRACESNIEKTVLSFDKYVNWEQESSDVCCNMLKKIANFGVDLNDGFWKLYLETLYGKIVNFDTETVIKIRRCFISEMREFLIPLKILFVNDNVPIISADEIKHIDSPSISVCLVNGSKIDDSVDYIQSLILNHEIEETAIENAKHIQTILLQKALSDKIVLGLYEFVKINKIVDSDYFDYLCELVKEGELEKGDICEYVNCLKDKHLPEHYLNKLNELCFDKGLSKDIVNDLTQRKLYTYPLLNIYDNQYKNTISFFENEDVDGVISACQIINRVNPEAVVMIRTELSRMNNGTPYEKYNKLYEGEYSIITINELCEMADFDVAISLIDASKFTHDNYKEYVQYINSQEHKGEECYHIFDYLFNSDYGATVCTDANVITAIVEAIDYNKVIFGSMTDTEIIDVVTLLNKPMNLVKLDSQKKFMRLVNCLVPDFENKIYQTEGFERYLSYINTCNMVSNIAVEIIVQHPAKYALNKCVTDKLLLVKAYEHYIVGKTLNDEVFTYPLEGVSDDEIIKFYNEKSIIWEYIKANSLFMNHFMSERLYRQLTETITIGMIEPLMSMKQTSDFLLFVLNNMTEDVISKYLLNLNEIYSEKDSIEISRILTNEKNIKYIMDENTFTHVEFRLWEDKKNIKGYKGSFKRKRNEYMAKKYLQSNL